MLVCESASVAQIAANLTQFVTVSDTLLTPGQYYAAIQFSDVTATRYCEDTGNNVLAWQHANGGAYGAFVNPCPATSNDAYVTWFMLRVKTNLGL